MINTKKGSPDLSVGSTFFIGIDDKYYPARFKVLSREGEKVKVEISFPKRPSSCGKCGHGRNLSVNAVTGVVVCMTTGCGHDFGYNIVPAIRTMKVSDFAPA